MVQIYNKKQKEWRKTLRVVKLTAFIILFFSLQLSANVLAQQTVTLSVKNVTVPKVLNQISRQTGLSVVYKESYFNNNDRVTLDVHNQAVRKVLDLCLNKDNYAYRVVNGTIVIKKISKSENQTVAGKIGTIKGNVRDATTGKPLIGADIFLKGTTIGTVTDTTGNFEINNLEPSKYTLEIRFIGYSEKKETVTVSENRTIRLNVQLEPSSVNLADVEVTAGTVVPTPIKEVPNAVTVITSRDITRENPQNIGQVLRSMVPGLIYAQSNPGTNPGFLSVRGATSFTGQLSTLQVYVNGVRIGDPEYITFMDPTIIKRIEVIPGPEASTIYGSGAISGVLEITTKTGIHSKSSLSGMLDMNTVDNKYIPGTNPLGQRCLLNATGGVGIFTYNVQANYVNDPQWLPMFGEQDLNLAGSMNFTHRKLSGGISVDNSNEFTSQGWNHFFEPILDSLSGGNPPNSASNTHFSTYTLNLAYKPNKNWINNFSGGFNEFRVLAYPRAPVMAPTPKFIVSKTNTERYSFAYNSSYHVKFSDKLSSQFTVGTNFTHYFFKFFGGLVSNPWDFPYISPHPYGFNNFGFYGQTLISIGKSLFITGGLRADKRPGGASKSYVLSPRIGLSYVFNLHHSWKIKARFAWGKAVTVPDATEMQGVVTSATVQLANPGLLSEEQKGYSTGFDLYKSNKFSFGFTYYNQEPKNLIQNVIIGTDSQGRTINQYENVAAIKNKGVEAKLTTHPAKWLTINLNYSKGKSIILNPGPEYSGGLHAGQTLPGPPFYTVSASIIVRPTDGTTIALSGFQYGHWIQTDSYGHLYDIYTGSNTSKRWPYDYYIQYPKFTEINVNITQRITSKLQAFLQIGNLLNTGRVESINTAPTEPRSIELGFRLLHLPL